jgi:hypothetical protein
MSLAAWGSALKSALAAASDTAKAAARSISESAAAASREIAAQAAAGRDALVDAGKKTAAVGVLGTEQAAASAFTTIRQTAAASSSLYHGVTQPITAIGGKAAQAFQKLKDKFAPDKPALVTATPCVAPDTAVTRAERINKRNELIAKGEGSSDPAARNAAALLRNDMKAVELARLSENTYHQSYDDPQKPADEKPPQPWQVMSDADLKSAGIDPKLLRASKAKIYSVPRDFPFEPKTVLAFQGTTSAGDDILADHDQALGLKTAQYTNAKELGKAVAKKFPDAEVTGHSLGGGKAQAAAVTGGLRGTMFNSAGLHPNSVDMAAEDLDQYSSQFVQYRAEGGIMKGGGDPLTGLQNSPNAQKALYGTSTALQGLLGADAWARQELGRAPLTDAVPEEHRKLAQEMSDRLLKVTSQEAAKNYELSKGKWYIPPALGEVRGVTSKNADGTDAPIKSQHSIVTLIDGLEARKSATVSTLLATTGTQGDAAAYLGPAQMLKN